MGKIIIYDSAGNAFVSYRVDGTFIEKQKAGTSFLWMNSMESDSEGTLLLCNNLSGGNYPPEYAYTLLYPDGETKDFDPFAPVSVTGYMTAFAQKPMTASGDEFKFIKFQTDSLFSIKDGKIAPLLRLDFGLEVISKEDVMSVGQYTSKEVVEYCLRNKNWLESTRSMKRPI